MPNASLEQITCYITWLEKDSADFIGTYETRLAAIELHYGIKAGYKPSQPRVPVGHPDGGQWTDNPSHGGGGGGQAAPREEANPYTDAIEEVYPLEAIGTGIALVVGGPAAALGAFSAIRAGKVANAIARGHAFNKHVINRKEFPEISTVKEFAALIKKILQNPTELRKLKRGRTAYWDDNTGTLIIKNQKDGDGGTAFRPLSGKFHFDEELD